MSRPAPQLLVSVRDAGEARDALAGGADWIDLKEPRNGPLGAVSSATARDVVEALPKETHLSAAAGELVAWPESPARELLAVSGLSHLKLGLAGCAGLAWQRHWHVAQRQIVSAGMDLVAVIYADAAAAQAPEADDVLAAVAEAGCEWVLWDTYDKASPSIDEILSPRRLKAQLAAARSIGCRTAVAGRLHTAALPRMPLELIDMIAVRGAVCRDLRDSAICCDKVTDFRHALVAARSGEGITLRLNPGRLPRRTSE